MFVKSSQNPSVAISVDDTLLAVQCRHAIVYRALVARLRTVILIVQILVFVEPILVLLCCHGASP